jgi:V-type H+-transporting ATPase subunit H
VVCSFVQREPGRSVDQITDVPELASAILQQPEPYKIFISLLNQSNNPEDPIPLFSATFLVNLISTSLTTSPKSAQRDEDALPQLFTYLSKLVKNQDSGLQDIGVQHISQLLRTSRSKELFWKQQDDTVDPLFDILRKAVGATKDNDSTLWGGNTSIRSSDTRFGGGVGLQLMYHVLLVLWQLSFEGELVGEGLEKYGIRDCPVSEI